MDDANFVPVVTDFCESPLSNRSHVFLIVRQRAQNEACTELPFTQMLCQNAMDDTFWNTGELFE